jgi:hypothetical protein
MILVGRVFGPSFVLLNRTDSGNSATLWRTEWQKLLSLKKYLLTISHIVTRTSRRAEKLTLVWLSWQFTHLRLALFFQNDSNSDNIYRTYHKINTFLVEMDVVSWVSVWRWKIALCLFCCCAMYIRFMSSYKNYTTFFVGGARGGMRFGVLHT